MLPGVTIRVLINTMSRQGRHENPWPRPGIVGKVIINMLAGEIIRVLLMIMSLQGGPEDPVNNNLFIA